MLRCKSQLAYLVGHSTHSDSNVLHYHKQCNEHNNSIQAHCTPPPVHIVLIVRWMDGEHTPWHWTKWCRCLPRSGTEGTLRAPSRRQTHSATGMAGRTSSTTSAWCHSARTCPHMPLMPSLNYWHIGAAFDDWHIKGSRKVGRH